MPFEVVAIVACLLACGVSALRLRQVLTTPANGDYVVPDARESLRPNALQRLGAALPGQPAALVVLALILVPGLLAVTASTLLQPELPSLAGVVGVGLPALMLLVLRDAASWRCRHFETQLVDATDLMNAAVQAGLNAHGAIETASLSGPATVRKELAEVLGRLDLGLPIEQALSRMRERYDCEGTRLLTQALVVKWHDGTDFRSLLRAVSALLHERLKLRRQVESQLSGARYAALFAGALPYLLIPVFLWRQPEWLDVLLEHPQGVTLLLSAALCQVAGFVWLRRILRMQE